MIIKYSKKHLRTDFIVGSLYLLSGILGIIFGSNAFIEYGFTALGIFYLATFFYKFRFPYLRIEDHILTCHVFASKKQIDLTQLTRIVKFTDEITFLTPHKKLKISTKLINKEDLPAFKEMLASLDLESEKNPFTHPVKN